MNTHTHIMKKIVLAASFVLSLALTSPAQSDSLNSFTKKSGLWHDPSNWGTGSIPSSEAGRIIISQGVVSVEEPVLEDINVAIYKAGEGECTLAISSDFQVTNLGIAPWAASTGRIEQMGGTVTARLLMIAHNRPEMEAGEGEYSLEAGKLEAHNLHLGTTGRGVLSLKGTGPVASVGNESVIGPQSTLRFYGTKAGFPTLSLGLFDIQPGATLEIDCDATVKPGKHQIILADEPLAGLFQLQITGSGAGRAKVLEKESGVVLEVK